MIKTVLGNIENAKAGVTLVHEHICCYNEYVYQMAKNAYIDKNSVADDAISYLKDIKAKHGLTTFVDCTPPNIGRDTELLKKVSEKAEINIVCATGFYFQDEPVLFRTSADKLCEYMITDAKAQNAGIIKCAVEKAEIAEFQEKLLRACAKAHKELGLPIVMHTNGKNQNGRSALEILLSECVHGDSVVVGHLSDSEDPEYLKAIAAHGCYIAFDRLYGNCDEEYIEKKVSAITELCRAGYKDKILLSHHALFFNGFDKDPTVAEKPRFAYVFEHMLPKLNATLAQKITVTNPANMLSVR